MANPELGAKQICPNCQSKFYDLGRRPAHCPKCGEDFDPEEALRTRRVRARSGPADYEDAEEKEAKPAPEDSDGFEDEADDTPEIDDAAAAEPIETDDDDDTSDPDKAAPGGGSDDLGVDFAEEGLEEDDSDDVPFLEDDEDEDFDDEIEGLPEEGDEDI